MDKRVITGKDTRRRHSEALKRDLVARSLLPGASVSALAQEYGINANLPFNWRRLHLRAQATKIAAIPQPVLLRVTVTPAVPAALPTAAVPAPPTRNPNGSIEIEIGTARVRVRGSVDQASLRSVVRALRELA
jgi:transposase